MALHTILYCHHYAQIGGGETSLLELFRTLDRSRFRPVLATPGKGPFPDAARALDVEVVDLEYGPLRRAVRLLRTAWRLSRVAREKRAALLHANGPASNLPAALAARKTGLPVVWHARTMVGPGEIDVDRYLSPLSSLIIANSEAIRRRFRRGNRSGEKSITIINGVDTERFHPAVSGKETRKEWGIETGSVVAGVVGRISPVKGQRVFLEAASLLHPRHPHLRFLIVGGSLFPGEEKHETSLRAFVAKRGLGETVLFTGHQRDVRPWIAALDICVLPSDAEGCGRALFEAMAMAKPVVGTNSGGTPEIVSPGGTGILVPPRDPAALAEAVGQLASDPAMRRRMGETGRRRIMENFTLKVNARRTEAAYLRLIEGRTRDG